MVAKFNYETGLNKYYNNKLLRYFYKVTWPASQFPLPQRNSSTSMARPSGANYGRIDHWARGRRQQIIQIVGIDRSGGRIHPSSIIEANLCTASYIDSYRIMFGFLFFGACEVTRWCWRILDTLRISPSFRTLTNHLSKLPTSTQSLTNIWYQKKLCSP